MTTAKKTLAEKLEDNLQTWSDELEAYILGGQTGRPEGWLETCCKEIGFTEKALRGAAA